MQIYKIKRATRQETMVTAMPAPEKYSASEAWSRQLPRSATKTITAIIKLVYSLSALNINVFLSNYVLWGLPERRRRCRWWEVWSQRTAGQRTGDPPQQGGRQIGGFVYQHAADGSWWPGAHTSAPKPHSRANWMRDSCGWGKQASDHRVGLVQVGNPKTSGWRGEKQKGRKSGNRPDTEKPASLNYPCQSASLPVCHSATPPRLVLAFMLVAPNQAGT